MSALKLQIIVVNWNGRELLETCLSSIIENCRGFVYEICVVDNASQDGSAAMLAERFQQVRLLRNAENVGFAKACNRGLKEGADSPYVLFLNPDTRVTGGAVRHLLDFLDAHHDVGAATCALVDETGRFQGAQGRRLLSIRSAFNQYFFLNRLSQRFFPGVFWARKPERACEVEWISGAVMMVRRAAIDGSEFFSELYFMYAEDMEASNNMRAGGWKLFFLPDATITHYMKGSIRKSGARIFATQVLSQTLYLQRNLPAWKRPTIRAIMACGYALRWLAYALLSAARGRPGDAVQSRDQSVYLKTLLRSGLT